MFPRWKSPSVVNLKFLPLDGRCGRNFKFETHTRNHNLLVQLSNPKIRRARCSNVIRISVSLH